MDSSRQPTLGRTLEGGSEEGYDNICTNCDISGVVREAKHYCAHCDYLFCKQCLADKHADFAGHKVVNVSDWGEKSSDKCPTCRLSGTQVSKYCLDHGQSCCLHCAATEHSSCSNVSDIDQLANGIYTSTDYNSLKSEVEQKLDDFINIRYEKEIIQEHLKNSRQNSFKRLDDFRQKVQDIFNKVEKETKDEFNEIYSHFDSALDGDLAMCEDTLASLRLHKMYMKRGNATKSKLFMKLKEIRHKLTEYDTSPLVMNEPLPQSFEKYECNTEHTVQKLIYRFESLKHATSAQEENVQYPRENVANPTNQRERDVTNGWKYKIRLPNDDHQCKIEGMCGLSNGTILLSDTKNKKLKLINPITYEVISYCEIPAEPRGVCAIDNKEAVAALSNKTLQFVTLKSMKPSRSISLCHRCYGFTYYGGRFYVTELNGKCVYVYDTYGNHLTNISEGDTPGERFHSIQNVYITRDGARIYVTDSMKGLLVLNASGTTLSTIYPNGLKFVSGVCTDTSGNVYVSGWRSHNVFKFGELGTLAQGAVVSWENGIGYPTSIWFNSVKSQLIVSNNSDSFGCDYLYVFNV